MAKLLIIDDEKQQLMLRAAILQAHGFEVEIAQTGNEAMSLFHQQDFDLVITDWLMPVMTGIDISRKMKLYRPNIPIILLTGWGNLFNKENIRDNPVDHLLSKPCDAEKLIEKVKLILLEKSQLLSTSFQTVAHNAENLPLSLN